MKLWVEKGIFSIRFTFIFGEKDEKEKTTLSKIDASWFQKESKLFKI